MNDGAILKRLIRQAGMTQELFAQKLGVSRASIVQLTQKAVISDEWKERICKYLQVDTSVFLGKELPTYGINTDPAHQLTANERDTLWKIIETQKGIIARLEQELKDSKD